jgi:hypothetical protein
VLAGQAPPLTVEQPPRQTITLTQGYSTTIRSERPFGKISITNPDIVDLVLRTDKTAVLIPQRVGRTNVDFLDGDGGLIGSVNIVVSEQKTTGTVEVYNHPSLSAHSSFHCQTGGCDYFEEIPAKEQAASPTASDVGRFIGGPPGMQPQ